MRLLSESLWWWPFSCWWKVVWKMQGWMHWTCIWIWKLQCHLCILSVEWEILSSDRAWPEYRAGRCWFLRLKVFQVAQNFLAQKYSIDNQQHNMLPSMHTSCGVADVTLKESLRLRRPLLIFLHEHCLLKCLVVASGCGAYACQSILHTKKWHWCRSSINSSRFP